MPAVTYIAYEFVENIPEQLKEGIIYISIPFTTAIHKCCCGCGLEVVTPFSPTDWKLIFDGKTISLHPSIGNWSFACQSHYWVKQNRIVWSDKWSEERINTGRLYDQAAKDKYFETTPAPVDRITEETTVAVIEKQKNTLLEKLKQWCRWWKNK